MYKKIITISILSILILFSNNAYGQNLVGGKWIPDNIYTVSNGNTKLLYDRITFDSITMIDYRNVSLSFLSDGKTSGFTEQNDFMTSTWNISNGMLQIGNKNPVPISFSNDEFTTTHTINIPDSIGGIIVHQVITKNIRVSCNSQIYYPDNDGDGYGENNPIEICNGFYVFPHYVLNNLDCDDTNPNDVNILVNDVPIPAGEYKAITSLSSSGTVENGLIEFKAGESITLDSGFSVEQGSTFIAEIETCN